MRRKHNVQQHPPVAFHFLSTRGRTRFLRWRKPLSLSRRLALRHFCLAFAEVSLAAAIVRRAVSDPRPALGLEPEMIHRTGAISTAASLLPALPKVAFITFLCLRPYVLVITKDARDLLQQSPTLRTTHQTQKAPLSILIRNTRLYLLLNRPRLRPNSCITGARKAIEGLL